MASKKKTTKRAVKAVTPRKVKRLHSDYTEKQWAIIASATLSRSEYELLTACPYERPFIVYKGDSEWPIVKRLIKLGLLERNPTAKDPTFRCTSRGEDLRQKYERGE